MQLVFNHSETGQNLATIEDMPCNGADDLFMAVFAGPTVTLLCAFHFAHADSDHFRQPAFNFSHKISVRLDAIDHDDAIGLPRIEVHEHLKTFDTRAERNSRHLGANLRADILRRHAVPFQYLALAAACTSTM